MECQRGEEVKVFLWVCRPHLDLFTQRAAIIIIVDLSQTNTIILKQYKREVARVYYLEEELEVMLYFKLELHLYYCTQQGREITI